MTTSQRFESGIILPLRKWMDHPRIQVSSEATWDASDDVVELEISTAALSGDFQKEREASPTYAWCLAYWMSKVTGRPWRARVVVRGGLPVGAKETRHFNRAGVLLSTYAEVLGDRFELEAEVPIPRLPDNAAINSESKPRETKEDASGERALEMALTEPGPLTDWLIEAVGGVQDGFRRQKPVGVFEGEVRGANRWAPAGGSQVDLCGRSPDGERLHLIELKTHGNTPVGIIPEALYYERVLRHFGEPRISVWLVAPKFHPLVERDGASPIDWLNDGLRGAGTKVGLLHIPSELWPKRELPAAVRESRSSRELASSGAKKTT